VKGCSIHDTFARCVTIHGSHGIKVRYSTYTIVTSWFQLFRQVAVHTITIDQTYNNTNVRYCWNVLAVECTIIYISFTYRVHVIYISFKYRFQIISVSFPYRLYEINIIIYI